MTGFPILSVTTFLPLVGVVLIFLCRGEEAAVKERTRQIALWTSVATLIASLFILVGFDSGSAAFQMVELVPWMPSLGIAYHVGVDGISVLFILLSTFLTPLCVLASWTSVQARVKEYMIAFLVLETFMVGTFCALDLLLFYIFFEGVLLPMYLIIGVWGGKNRVYAAYKFFLYTLFGSVLMLVAFLAIHFLAGTTDIPELFALKQPFSFSVQIFLWLAFFSSFAVKVPMWPVHTWLPDAHVEAPTAGSVILAGVLLKMGGYGFLRLSIPLLPEATHYFAPLVYSLSIVAVIYTSYVALVQEDMKKLIAYSSVAHMGYVTIGIFTLNTQGVEGSIFQMLSHGIVSSALFLCVGVVYDRLHSREIARYGGLATNMPRYALVFMIMMLASVGLPGTSGFVGEFLILVGAFQANLLVAVLAATGLVLGAMYMLWLYRRVIFGKLVKADCQAMADLGVREFAVFAPLVVLVLWMGIYPVSFTALTSASVSHLIHSYEVALSQPSLEVVAQAR
ncbi:MAG: NADH-quinone oxidoreductase subunit M [Rhodospirillaceae bacterium]